MVVCLETQKNIWGLIIKPSVILYYDDFFCAKIALSHNLFFLFVVFRTLIFRGPEDAVWTG